MVVEIALKAAEQILEAAGRLVEHPQSKNAQSMLVRGSHGVLEGTMKVCCLTLASVTLYSAYV